ncbi:DNA/RNA non-specific endonuclease [Kroppenstedtia eburnea]|uniref:DNA/RNA non-specific endonuclease n=1 Tax=Kroppenstedtia eburnea TaxID=714067 RepID=UPI00363147FB
MLKKINKWTKGIVGVFRSSKGSSTIEYVMILVIGAIFASLLLSALQDQEGLIKEKIEQAIHGELKGETVENQNKNIPPKSPKPSSTSSISIKDRIKEWKDKAKDFLLGTEDKNQKKSPVQETLGLMFGDEVEKFETFLDVLLGDDGRNNPFKKAFDLSNIFLFGSGKNKDPVERTLDIILSFPPFEMLNKGNDQATQLAKSVPKDEKAFSIFGYDIKTRELFDIGASLNPVKSFKEIFTGYNKITEEKLSLLDRALNLIDFVPEGGPVAKGGLSLVKKPLKGLLGGIGEKISKPAKKFIDPARNKVADVACGWFGSQTVSSPYVTIYLAKGSATDDCKKKVVDALGGGAKKVATQIEEVEYGKHFTRVNRKKALKPNVKYTTPKGYTYKTDGKGRISHVQGDLKLETEKRNVYAQRKAGDEDRLPDDEGGHLIASIFGGEGGLDNLVPQNGNLNKGEWKKMENMWADALRSGKKVKVKIKPVYNGDSKRPDRFEVQYKIDDEVWEEKSFDNAPGGQADG